MQALEDVCRRVRTTDDDLTVAVFESDRVETTLDDVTSRVERRLSNNGVTASVRQLTAHPGSQLVQMADGEGFDRLLVGVESRSPMGKIRLDSVTEFVIMNAETSVTLVRTAEAATVADEPRSPRRARSSGPVRRNSLSPDLTSGRPPR